MDFSKFAQAVAKQWAFMQKHDLYRTSVTGDELYAKYLSFFPEGTNLIFREKQEYDCNCCKNFIRNVGGVVAIVEGKLVTVWDNVLDADANFVVVAAKMEGFIKGHQITEPFLHFESVAGSMPNKDKHDPTKRWEHFFVNIDKKFVVTNGGIGTRIAEWRSGFDVFTKGLEKINLTAIDMVIELIQGKALYRGEEYLSTIQAFQTLAAAYKVKTDAEDADTLLWKYNAFKLNGAHVTRIANSVIGTLLLDLSDKEDLEIAVKKFESKVAPTNYKRTVALVTDTMVKNAKQAAEDLHVTSAMVRRHAKLDDLAITNVLYKAVATAPVVVADPFANVANAPVAAPKVTGTIDIQIEDFIRDVLPSAQNIEVFMENRLEGHLVSLLTAADPTANKLFRWDNEFSWAYKGDVTDSIKERVKKAGGKVEGDLCCRLAWDYRDDLDFHMYEPQGGHVFFGNRRSNAGGVLDVDANGGDGMRENPVENIVYEHAHRMRDGVYKLAVNNYSRREPDKQGFEVEVELQGTVYTFSYPKALRAKEEVQVAEFTVKNGKIEVKPLLPSVEAARTFWGIKSQQFHRVTAVLNSPNHWGANRQGNKHLFFMIEGAQSDEAARGFYNEYLRSELAIHRKVFEILGARTKVDPVPAADQVSGIGFSSTINSNLLLRVTGATQRTFKVYL